MFKNYYEVRDWLESFIPQTYTKKNLGLERIRYLLKLLGNPQDKFKSIHVAGTSGKSSTAFYIAKLLQFAGPVSSFPPASAQSSQPSQPSGSSEPSNLRAVGSPSRTATHKKARDIRGIFDTRDTFKVGLHLSPHLVDIRERLQINNQLIPMYRYIRLMNEIKLVVAKIKKTKPELIPSYFEILVAATFLYFAQEKVDFAVIEVGLGGRLDATNVLKPQISLITDIGMDHTDILGKTIEKIAFEKAGIIKEKVLVVTGAIGKALKVIEKVAKEKNALLIKVNTQLGVQPLKSDIKDNLINYYDIERYIPKNLVFSNALLAYAAVSALGFALNKQLIRKALAKPFLGRFEAIDDNVIIDGAHNPDKIRALIRWIKNAFFARHSRESGNLDPRIREDDINGVALVLAFKKGKNWKKMIDLLVKNLPIKSVIATQFWAVTDMGRLAAVEPQEIADYIKSKWKVKVESNINSQESVFNAVNLKSYNLKSKDLVLVTGSLYLVGEVRTVWRLPDF